MTSCLDGTACPLDKRNYRVPCRFSLGFNLYVCRPINTCVNIDNSCDCCAYNVADCFILESALHVPTFQPTVSTSNDRCSQSSCHSKYNTNQCYLYESVNTDIVCNDNDKQYCCTELRADCCYTSHYATVVTFICIMTILVVYIVYRTIVESHNKILPVKIETPTHLPGKYTVVANV
jgi:hypothetical protein